MQALLQLREDVLALDAALAESPRAGLWVLPPHQTQSWRRSTEVLADPGHVWERVGRFLAEAPDACGWLEGTSAVRVHNPADATPWPATAGAAGLGWLLNAELGNRRQTLRVQHTGAQWVCTTTRALVEGAPPAPGEQAPAEAAGLVEEIQGLVEAVEHLCSHDGAGAIRYDVLHRFDDDGLKQTVARVTGVAPFSG